MPTSILLPSCSFLSLTVVGLLLVGFSLGELAAEDQPSEEVIMQTSQGKRLKLTLQNLENARGYQYCELVFNYGDKGSDIYSTSPLAPADLKWWDELDLQQLAKEFGATSIYKNGPQRWSMDEVGVLGSAPIKVGGVDMIFGAHLPPGTLEAPKYQVFSPAKTQNLLWKKGKPTYQLVDPQGQAYILQGYKVSANQLTSLGEKFEKLPPGWSFQVKQLDQDLVMKLTPNAPIPSVQDEFNQIYIRVPH